MLSCRSEFNTVSDHAFASVHAAISGGISACGLGTGAVLMLSAAGLASSLVAVPVVLTALAVGAVAGGVPMYGDKLAEYRRLRTALRGPS